MKKRSNLLVKCLELFIETGAHLNAIIFNDAHVNKAMCTKLNASFKYGTLISYITNCFSNEPFFLFLDHDEINQECFW